MHKIVLQKRNSFLGFVLPGTLPGTRDADVSLLHMTGIRHLESCSQQLQAGESGGVFSSIIPIDKG
jgi:hypothetical protein